MARRVLFLNDYPMCKARALHASGSYPGQHLWGMDQIHAHGWEPIFFPDETWVGPPQRARFAIQQMQAWTASGGVDLVYSACQFNVWLLARLRRVGLLRRPLVTLVHHPLRGPLQGKGWVAGHDGLLFLDRKLELQVRTRHASAAPYTAAVAWGPDLSFARGAPPLGEPVDVISAGKSDRDYATLIEASRGQPWTVDVYCASHNVAPGLPVPANVFVHAEEGGQPIGYLELYRRSRQCRVMAVPLSEARGLAGLTSVLDALALGKPLVITRNPWLPFDPEEAGIGISVAAGDVQGWRAALGAILSSPQKAAEMGRRAGEMAQRINTSSFAAELARHFDAVMERA